MKKYDFSTKKYIIVINAHHHRYYFYYYSELIIFDSSLVIACLHLSFINHSFLIICCLEKFSELFNKIMWLKVNRYNIHMLLAI